MSGGGSLTWFFAHGSLMFDPGFEPEIVLPGRVTGWERRFGQPSVRNWGRPGSPAPTCSLVRGGVCDGLAYGVARETAAAVLRALVAREANDPTTVTVTLQAGDVTASTWVMGSAWNESTAQELVEAAVVNIGGGGGPRGDAWDYVNGVAGALDWHQLSDSLVSEYRDALASRLGDRGGFPPR